jgi:ketosteroid isomerase-like protein
MQPTSRRLLAIAALLAAGLAVYLVVSAPPPSDQAQISQEISEMSDAAQRKSASGVMRHVSASYHDQLVSNSDQLSVFLSRHLLSGTDPISIGVDSTAITVSGDTATSVSHVRIIANESVAFDGNITLHWAREASHRFLIVPSHTWRVVSAEYPANFEGGM